MDYRSLMALAMLSLYHRNSVSTLVVFDFVQRVLLIRETSHIGYSMVLLMYDNVY